MLRPLHFVLLFIALTFVVTVLGVEGPAENVPVEAEEQLEPESNDLEADASYWRYSRPYGYYGHHGGWRSSWGYGRSSPWYYGRGWGGRGWW